jgi:hypothetical protein
VAALAVVHVEFLQYGVRHLIEKRITHSLGAFLARAKGTPSCGCVVVTKDEPELIQNKYRLDHCAVRILIGRGKVVFGA